MVENGPNTYLLKDVVEIEKKRYHQKIMRFRYFGNNGIEFQNIKDPVQRIAFMQGELDKIKEVRRKMENFTGRPISRDEATMGPLLEEELKGNEHIEYKLDQV